MEQADHHVFSVRKRLSFQVSKNARSSETDVEEQAASEDDLLQCFSPVLNSMRIFGLYFTRASRRIHNASTSSTVTTDRAVRRKWNGGRIYAVVIMVIAWLNVTRMLSVFDKTDKFGFVLLLKLAMISSGLLGALLQTACFVACQTGNLDRVFRDATLSKSDHIRYRRLAVIHATVIWILLMADVLIFLVPTFITETDLSLSMTPVGVHFSVSNQLLIVLAKVMLSVFFILADSTVFFSHSVNYICYSKVLHCTDLRLKTLWFKHMCVY